MEWFNTIQSQINTLAEFPESYSVSSENDDFSFVIRDKLIGLGRKPSYRAVFTIHEDVVYVLSVKRFTEEHLRPEDVDLPLDD